MERADAPKRGHRWLLAIDGSLEANLAAEYVARWASGQGVVDVYVLNAQPVGSYRSYAQAFKANYAKVHDKPGKLWNQVKGVAGQVYDWPRSTYIAKPPFFDGFTMQPATLVAGVQGARIMALFGDSITTDHISPAGSFKETTPAGMYLVEQGVLKADFNSYGARRGHHEVMMLGTFANVRVKNLMLPLRADGSREEGGVTLIQPGGEKMAIYDAAMKYVAQGTPTVIFGGEEYGTGSSRDWAAKGTQLLGIKAVVARSFERIHRSNLVGMGVLPLQFKPGDSWQSLGLRGDEVIDVVLDDEIEPQSQARLVITGADGKRREVAVLLRIDTAIEVDYYKHGGILPYVLRQLLAA